MILYFLFMFSAIISVIINLSVSYCHVSLFKKLDPLSVVVLVTDARLAVDIIKGRCKYIECVAPSETFAS